MVKGGQSNQKVTGGTRKNIGGELKQVGKSTSEKAADVGKKASSMLGSLTSKVSNFGSSISKLAASKSEAVKCTFDTKSKECKTRNARIQREKYQKHIEKEKAQEQEAADADKKRRADQDHLPIVLVCCATDPTTGMDNVNKAEEENSSAAYYPKYFELLESIPRSMKPELIGQNGGISEDEVVQEFVKRSNYKKE